jgi:hypothetical protein
MVFAQALDYPGMLLRHDLDAAADEDDANNQYDDSDFHGASCCVILELGFIDQ